MDDVVQIQCPYCGELNEIFVDYSGGTSQSYYEDCRICCRPWEVNIRIVNNTPSVTVRRSE